MASAIEESAESVAADEEPLEDTNKASDETVSAKVSAGNYRNNELKAPAFKRGDERPYSLPATQVLSSIEYMKSDIIVIDTYVGGAFHVYSTPFA